MASLWMADSSSSIVGDVTHSLPWLHDFIMFIRDEVNLNWKLFSSETQSSHKHQRNHLTSPGWLAGWVELMLCDVMWWDDRQTTCIHNWITQRRCRWGLGARKYLFSTTVTCVWLSGLSSIHFFTLPVLLLLLSCRCCCCCLNAAVLTMNLRLPHHYHTTTYVHTLYPTR